MRWYHADLHIHSVLSPCGDLDMSPARIIHEAQNKGLDIIGITDHNASAHAKIMIDLGKKAGISVFPGMEITTKEEVHCLTLFENIEKTEKFQQIVDDKLPNIINNPDKFGYQVIVNEKEDIIAEQEKLLISGIDLAIEEVERIVHELNGVFILAHVDRKANSIFSQMGFIPKDLNIDAVEISANCEADKFIAAKPELKEFTIITNSDAHFIKNIARSSTKYYMNSPSFEEWKKTLAFQENRKIKLT